MRLFLTSLLLSISQISFAASCPATCSIDYIKKYRSTCCCTCDSYNPNCRATYHKCHKGHITKYRKARPSASATTTITTTTKTRIQLELERAALDWEKYGAVIVSEEDKMDCFNKFGKPGEFAADPLPLCFQVFVDEEGTTSLHQGEGFSTKVLPTLNIFMGNPGCYISCYSHNPDQASYSVNEGTYVIGQIRIKGKYSGKTCVPLELGKLGPSGEHTKALCSKTFQCIGNSCWAGGNTGGWFGLQ